MLSIVHLVGCVLVFSITVNADPTHSQNYTCTVDGQEYLEGESIGDPCDGCLCSRYGTMCQLRLCQPAPCTDKVVLAGECCATCPNGPNCEYVGFRGRTLVPHRTGCRYAEDIVCFCYYNRSRRQMVPYCMPSLPWEDNPPCEITN